MTIRLDRSRPVSERVGNGIEGFEDSSRMTSRPLDDELAIGKQSLGKRLLQNEADGSDSGEHYETAVAPRWTEDLVCEFAQSIRALCAETRCVGISTQRRVLGASTT